MLEKPSVFTKLTAAGNDFICIDNTDGRFDGFLESEALQPWVRAICRRGLGVGGDGIIFGGPLGDGAGVDICARFMEPDGSEAELCGNGTACFTWWSVDKGLVSGPEVHILTAAGAATGTVAESGNGRVRVCVPDPRDLQMNIALTVKGESWVADYIVAGTPHVVANVDDINTLDLPHWGPGFRHHPRFGLRGANANFVQVLDIGEIAVRTYEFGVEAETLACGTGSSAAAILTCIRNQWPECYRNGEKPVRVHVRSGAVLRVWFTCHDNHKVTDVCLETRVQVVYEGTLRAEFPAPDTLEADEEHEPRAASVSTV